MPGNDNAAVIGSSSRSDAGKKARRWAPRTRTGCTVCRARRIKCDETKPQCLKCVASNKPCYYFFPGEVSGSSSGSSPPNDKLAITSPSDSPESSALSLSRRSSVSKRLEPNAMAHEFADLIHKDWHYVETVAFYNQVVLPHCQDSQVIPNDYNVPHGSEGADPSADSVVAFALSSHIAAISRLQGNMLQPSMAYGTSHLWSRLYERIQSTLNDINEDIRLGPASAAKKVFTKIQALLGVELMLQSPGWRPHMEGFLAFLHFCGGPRMLLYGQLGTKLAIVDVVVQATVANTVAPPESQIHGTSLLSKEDLTYVYTRTSHPAFPCPTKLFLSVIAITQLRVKAYSGVSVAKVIRPGAKATLNRIDAFVPEEWNERYHIPDIPEVPLLGNIFKNAVALYAILTLPLETQHLPATFKSREETRNRLFQLLKLAWQSPQCRFGLNWPLAVVGCALKAGLKEEKDLVKEYLDHIAEDPVTSQPGVVSAKLQIFWASGLTSWDDCWKEAFVLIG